MSDAIDLVEKWIDAINRQDLSALEAVLAPDFVWELGTSTTTGAAASVDAWRLWFAGFPDFRFEPLRSIADDDLVCTRLRMTGSHGGEFRFRGTGSLDRGLPPTGRRFDLPGCSVHQVEGSRIARLWAYWDTMTLLRQLGIVPG